MRLIRVCNTKNKNKIIIIKLRRIKEGNGL